MDRYAVFRIGGSAPKLLAVRADKALAVDDYLNLVARTEAALVRVGGPDAAAVAVLAAGGADPDTLAKDPAFLAAVRRAVGPA